jgi:hypothetical protein
MHHCYEANRDEEEALENRDGGRSLPNTLFTGAMSSLHGELGSQLPNFAPKVEIDRQGGPDNVLQDLRDNAANPRLPSQETIHLNPAGALFPTIVAGEYCDLLFKGN